MLITKTKYGIFSGEYKKESYNWGDPYPDGFLMFPRKPVGKKVVDNQGIRVTCDLVRQGKMQSPNISKGVLN